MKHIENEQKSTNQTITSQSERLTVAVPFGGCSSEYGVSLHSAAAVIANLDREKYEVIPIGITPEGQWYRYYGGTEHIANDTWRQERCVPIAADLSQRDGGMLELAPEGNQPVKINCVLPILHGKNGEDGTVQGMFELLGIPVAGCGVLASALCMDKDRAHKLAELAGVSVPKALTMYAQDEMSKAEAFGEQIGYPLFVKPVRAGSSYGVSKVYRPSELAAAVENAFCYDNQVILEEAIEGFEVGCAVMGREELTVGEVDEIELSGGFFDFTEKYTLKTSAIHVPARISREAAERVKETAQILYRAMDCSGFARVDMFYTPQGKIVFNEINTIPGMTEHSRFPGMMKAAGISLCEILDNVICQVLR